MKNDSVSSCIGMVVSLVVVVIIAAVANGWALATIWNWFIPPIFGLTTLTFAQAIGVSMVFSLFTGTKSSSSESKKDDKTFGEALVYSIVVPLLTPALTVLFAWIILQFAF